MAADLNEISEVLSVSFNDLVTEYSRQKTVATAGSIAKTALAIAAVETLRDQRAAALEAGSSTKLAGLGGKQ